MTPSGNRSRDRPTSSAVPEPLRYPRPHCPTVRESISQIFTQSEVHIFSPPFKMRRNISWLPFPQNVADHRTTSASQYPFPGAARRFHARISSINSITLHVSGQSEYRNKIRITVVFLQIPKLMGFLLLCTMTYQLSIYTRSET